MILTASLILWAAVGLLSGEMLIGCSLDILEETSELDGNFSFALVAFTLAALISLPWLLWQAITEALHIIIRR